MEIQFETDSKFLSSLERDDMGKYKAQKKLEMEQEADAQPTCHNCGSHAKLTRFRSIQVCGVCEETLSNDEKQYRGQAND